MGDVIYLHKEKGVNPHLTFCRRCGDTGPEIMMLGNRDSVTTCPACKTANYGSRPSEKCGSCGSEMYGGATRKLEDSERLPSSSLCAKCEELSKKELELVRQGGLFFRCKECGRGGVILANSALPIREKIDKEKYAVPNADGLYPECGIEFDKCVQHGPMPGEEGAATDG